MLAITVWDKNSLLPVSLGLVFEDATDNTAFNPFDNADSAVTTDVYSYGLCSASNEFVPRDTLDAPTVDHRFGMGDREKWGKYFEHICVSTHLVTWEYILALHFGVLFLNTHKKI